MERMLSNTTNVIHYYRKSAKLVKDFKQKNMIHIVYLNLIDTLLLNKDHNAAKLCLYEYHDFIDSQNIDDLFKFNNHKLEFARQIKDKVMLYEALVEGRIQILPKISFKEKLFFEISELRIRFNSQLGWEEKLFEIQHYFSDYSNLEFPERYHVFKEIFIILEKLSKSSNLGPFGQMYRFILNYFESVSAEIDKYLLTLPDYCVYERCYWESEKVFLRRIVKGNITQEMEFRNIQSRLEHFKNIKDIHIEHGNYIKAMDADLNIVDETMAHATNLESFTMKSQMRNTMQEHLQIAIEMIDKFKRHPETNILKLRAARYAFFLDDLDIAKQYFEDFKNSKISINHYADWLQKYYYELATEFNGLQK